MPKTGALSWRLACAIGVDFERSERVSEPRMLAVRDGVGSSSSTVTHPLRRLETVLLLHHSDARTPLSLEQEGAPSEPEQLRPLAFVLCPPCCSSTQPAPH